MGATVDWRTLRPGDCIKITWSAEVKRTLNDQPFAMKIDGGSYGQCGIAAADMDVATIEVVRRPMAVGDQVRRTDRSPPLSGPIEAIDDDRACVRFGGALHLVWLTDLERVG